MAYTWIKIYTEILHDSKIGRLPVYLRWRFVELCCLAGEHGNGGALQPVEDMAWVLRSSPEEVVKSLRSLAEIGVVQESQPGKWVVVNFAKRQARMSDQERQERFRAGDAKPQKNPRKKSQVNEEVSQVSHNFVTEVEEEVEEDSRERLSEPVAEKLAACKFKFNPNSGTIIQIWKDDFPDDVILRAIDESVSHGARSISYVDKILISWKADGVPLTRDEQIIAKKQKGKPNGQNSGPAKAPPVYSDEERELGARLRAEREAKRAELVPTVQRV